MRRNFSKRNRNIKKFHHNIKKFLNSNPEKYCNKSLKAPYVKKNKQAHYLLAKNATIKAIGKLPANYAKIYNEEFNKNWLKDCTRTMAISQTKIKNK